MDDRISKGRANLASGEAALAQGDVHEARRQFEASLRQFRGPELRMGEAHAQRGLATVELSVGNTESAEQHSRAAIRGYQELIEELDRLEDGPLSESMSGAAREGRAHALVVLGEVLSRTGRSADARSVLERARTTFDTLGDLPSSAGVWAALGRLAVRAGDYDSAKKSYDSALELYNRSDNHVGQVGMFLTLAELHRLRGELGKGEAVLNMALVVTQATADRRLQARVLRAMGALMMQSEHLDEARRCYHDALLLVRDSGDREVEAYTLLGLGEVQSRSGDGTAIDCLVDGARILGDLNHQHGVATALFQIAEHGSRALEPGFGLVASEGARRLWLDTDPVRGVGQALRMVVKSLAGVNRFREAHLAAEARAAVAGHMQPNAIAVRDFYRKRSPAEWLDEVAGMSARELHELAAAQVAAVLRPIFEEIGLPHTSLNSVPGALRVIEELATRLPRPTQSEEDDDGQDDASISGVWDMYLMEEDTEVFANGEQPPLEDFYGDLLQDDETEEVPR